MKNIRLLMLCLFVLLLGSNADAQGIKVYKNNGTVIEVLYSELDSIVGVPDNGAVNNPVISLNGHAGNEKGENKDSYIMFSISCPSHDASYVELIVADKAQVDAILANGLSLEEVAMSNKGSGLVLDADAINKVNSDVYSVSFDNSDGVVADTEYSCIAIVENNKGRMSVCRHDIKTEAAAQDDVPLAVELSGKAGDPNGNNKSSALTFTASCSSKNASYAEAFIADASFVNDILKDMSLEELMTYNAGIGKILPMEDLEKLNSGSLSLTWDQLNENTEYSLLFCVKTKSGEMLVKRCDVKTEPDL